MGGERSAAMKKKKKNAKSGGFESLGLSPNVFKGIKRNGYKAQDHAAHPLWLRRRCHRSHRLRQNGRVSRPHDSPPQPAHSSVWSQSSDSVPYKGPRPSDSEVHQRELAHFTDLRISLLVGGDSMESQFEELAQSPDIIIATPGRLMHHLSEVDDMSLRSAEYVVFYEADCLFGMGFAEQLHKILAQLGENRQTLLFGPHYPVLLLNLPRLV